MIFCFMVTIYQDGSDKILFGEKKQQKNIYKGLFINSSVFWHLLKFDVLKGHDFFY